MGFFGDVFDFEQFKLGNMWDKYKKDPERLFLGINTPLEGKLWGTVLGKDYSPTVDMYGGATQDDVQKARQAGINTGPGESMHGLARAITSMYAGGAAGKAMGFGGSAAGGGTAEAGGSFVGPANGSFVGSNGVATSYPVSMGPGATASSPGLLTSAMDYAKPVSNALSAANSAKGLLSSPERPITPSPIMTPMPNNNLGQMVSGMQQEQANRLAMDQQNRQMRRQMIRGGLL